MLNKLLLTHKVNWCSANLHKVTAIIFAIVAALALGIHIGRTYTIRQAELLETTSNTYYISFGDEVHEYTFEEEVTE